jgi:hypothetical protein
MKKQLTLIATALLAVGMVSPVNATTFSVTNVDGDWSNAVADPVGGVITITNSVASGGLSTARWGTSTGYGCKIRRTSNKKSAELRTPNPEKVEQ